MTLLNPNRPIGGSFVHSWWYPLHCPADAKGRGCGCAFFNLKLLSFGQIHCNRQRFATFRASHAELFHKYSIHDSISPWIHSSSTNCDKN